MKPAFYVYMNMKYSLVRSINMVLQELPILTNNELGTVGDVDILTNQTSIQYRAIIGPPAKRHLNVNSVKISSFKVALFLGPQQPRLSVQEIGRDTRTVATILVKSLFHGWMLR